MPQTAVRKHNSNTFASTTPTSSNTKSVAANNSAGRKPAITATAPKLEDFHTSSSQRAHGLPTGTHSQTPQLSSSMPAVAAIIDATKQAGSLPSSADESADSPNLGKRFYSSRRYCFDYLAGRCHRRSCKFPHPPEGDLAPCRNFFAGTCDNPRCPRPHITNWGNPYKEIGETESCSSDEEDPPHVPSRPTTTSVSVVAENRTAVVSPPEISRPLPQRFRVICRNFKKGVCRNGDSCPRMHDLESSQQNSKSKEYGSNSDSRQAPTVSETTPKTTEIKPPPSNPPPDTRELCRKNLAGRCRKGEHCHYRHDTPALKPDGSVKANAFGSPLTEGSSVAAHQQRGPIHKKPVVKGDSQEALLVAELPTKVVDTKPTISKRDRREPCRKNLRGKCRKGNRCPYRHEASDHPLDGLEKEDVCETAPPESTAIVPDQTEKGGHASGKELCKKFILHGTCPRGNGCPHLHPSRDVWTQYLPDANDICPLFLAGQCRDGAKCRLRHSAPEASSSKQSKPSVQVLQGPASKKKAVLSQAAAAPLANRNGRSAATSNAKAGSSKTRENLQNVPPATACTDKGKRPQRSPLSSKPTATDQRPGHVSPSSTCAETSPSVSDEEPSSKPRNPRSQNSRSAPPLTADTSMSSIFSEPHHPPTPRGENEPSHLMREVARILNETKQRPIPRDPFEKYQRAFNAQATETDFTVQPKAPIPLFPPGLGIEQRHGVGPAPEHSTHHIPETVSINVLDAVTVTFGPGLQVNNLKTGFESTFISLLYIPATTKSETITRLLSKYGEVQHVEMSDAKGNDVVTVKAAFATNAEAVRACTALDNNKSIFGTRISAKHASFKSTALGKGFVQDGTVRIEFPAPQKAAYAGYENVQLAEEAIRNARNTYDYDCMLDAEVWHGVPSVGGITVKFKGLPPDAQLDFVNQFGKNKGTMIERPNYTSSIEYIGRVLLRDLEKYGEIEKVTFMAPPYERQTVTAFARFKSPAGAASACAVLNNRTPPWIGRGLLTLKHLLNIQYALPSDVWDAIRDDVITMSERFRTDLAPGWVQWRMPSNRKSPVQVKLCASRLPVLSKLKIAFDAVLRGERVTEDGHWVWDPFFSRNAGAKFIDIVRSSHRNVLINVDMNKRYIALFGPPGERAVVHEKILWKVRNLRDQVFHTFPLDGGLIGLFVNADLMKLQEELGHENVILDPANQVLKVRGNEDAVKVTRLILQDAKSRHVMQRKFTRSSCPICLDEASLPVTLPCGHTWCKTCFTDYILASVDNRTFPLRCLGNEGKCSIPIPVVTVRDLLSSEQFATVTRASYLSYIHSRPSEFFYCPTPDCPQVYRSAAPGTVMQCPSCLVRICARCHIESHEGTQCVDREREDRRLFEQWSRTRDVKNCPGCKTTIERIAGCNHVTCAHCKTHICWQCLRTFKESGEVYDHMRSAHGGIGVEEFWF